MRWERSDWERSDDLAWWADVFGYAVALWIALGTAGLTWLAWLAATGG